MIGTLKKMGVASTGNGSRIGRFWVSWRNNNCIEYVEDLAISKIRIS